jgi:hypothetical protein
MKNLILIITLALFGLQAIAQLERVNVETYYVSDANDATDITGGNLPVGSKTYRIYLDLVPGTKVKSLFGTIDHPFRIASTDTVFNNVNGNTFGKDFTKVSYSENTMALDSYLTIGQTAKQGSKLYFGLPKIDDVDGSFIGGVNNDGGSAMQPQGLLINSDSNAGLALTSSDGMDTLLVSSAVWNSVGVVDFTTGNDSTIFGSLEKGLVFESSNFLLESSIAYQGKIAEKNEVLIAQVTTLGDLSFELNVSLEFIENGNLVTMNYVATDSLLDANTAFNPFLSYPFACGCTDPDYLEFNSAFVCDLEGSCIHLISIGCMDSLACNYDPNANVNVSELCCYPGSCNGRDIAEVCPELNGESLSVQLFPNPVSDNLTVNILQYEPGEVTCEIYSQYGNLIQEMNLGSVGNNHSVTYNLSDYVAGLYHIQIVSSSGKVSKMFFKL